MSEKHLHIVSFDVPYPPDYGGVIDVFYKLRALKKAGVHIHLHCFQYGREKAAELDELCETIHYYPRKQGFSAAFSFKPFIVKSRESEALKSRLLADGHPVLFEGLHTCSLLSDEMLKRKKKIYRESNIEHQYYFHLFKAATHPFKKFYFLSEAFKLKRFQKQLTHAGLMLAVSQSDTDYLKKHFPGHNVVYLPSFHPNEKVSALPGKGDYALYHGNLSVAENHKAATFLIREVFSGSPHRLVIAGKDAPKNLKRMAGQYKNVELIGNPDDKEMFDLIKNAHVNVLITFQATGLKLKLLNTLFNGRFCLVNPEMIQGTGLEPLCEVATNPTMIRQKLDTLFKQDFDTSLLQNRVQLLEKNYLNKKNADKLVRMIFG